MSLEQETANGALAQKVHDSIKERLELIRDNLHKEWESSKADDSVGREHIWMMLKALTELERSYLRDIMTGKMAQKQLGEENGRADR